MLRLSQRSSTPDKGDFVIHQASSKLETFSPHSGYLNIPTRQCHFANNMAPNLAESQPHAADVNNFPLLSRQ
jgi:hypothetical protein